MAGRRDFDTDEVAYLQEIATPSSCTAPTKVTTANSSPTSFVSSLT